MYRCHVTKIRYPRCWIERENQEGLACHLQAEVPCQIAQQPPVEGVCPRKLELLKCKKKQSLDDPGEEGRWRDIYRILFPGARVPSSCKSSYMSSLFLNSRMNFKKPHADRPHQTTNLNRKARVKFLVHPPREPCRGFKTTLNVCCPDLSRGASRKLSKANSIL